MEEADHEREKEAKNGRRAVTVQGFYGSATELVFGV